jgi:hypothetical protein
MASTINLHDLDGSEYFQWGRYTGSSNVTKKTATTIRQPVMDGYTIYVGNNPKMATFRKWRDFDVKRISMITGNASWHSKRTIWAAKRIINL